MRLGAPPVIGLRANLSEFGFGVDQAGAILDRQFILFAHCDGVDGTDLGAHAAIQASSGPQDEFSEFAISFIGGNDVHFET